ncbi:MAG: hypothetical protein WDW36_003136 [Sanguina aurantia]
MRPLPEKTEPSEDAEDDTEPGEKVELEPEKVVVDVPATDQPEKVVQNTDNDEQLVTRLITRIAELEEKLYQKDLDQPVRPASASHHDEIAPRTSLSKPKEGFFSALRETLAKLDVKSGSTTPGPPSATSSTLSPYHLASSTLLALAGPRTTAYSALNTGEESDSQGPESSGPSSTTAVTTTTSSTGFHTTTGNHPPNSNTGSSHWNSNHSNSTGTAAAAAAPPVFSLNATPASLRPPPPPSFSSTSSPSAATAAATALSLPQGASSSNHASAAGAAWATPGSHAQPRNSTDDGGSGNGSSGNGTGSGANGTGGNSAWFNTLSTAAYSWGQKGRDAKAHSSSSGVSGAPTGGLMLAHGAGNDGREVEFGDGGFSEARALEMLHARQQRISHSGAIGPNGHSQGDGSRPAESNSRYVFDPVDVQAEMEVTVRVRKAAAEALMEANEKLKSAEDAQRSLQLKLEAAQDLEQEVRRLQRESDEARDTKRTMEYEMIGLRSEAAGIKASGERLGAELEAARAAAEIWKSGGDEAEKVKAENALLRKQLTTRLNELQSNKQRLADSEADKQRLMRDGEELITKMQWLQKINVQLEDSAMRLEGFKKAACEWQERFAAERNVRRKLHEQMQVLRGNIRVMCRVRPLQPDSRPILAYPLEGVLGIAPPDKRPQEFEFDHVFGPDATQALVFDEVSPLVRSCADGFNVCIFAYGQTGSGKTHTMEGSSDSPGINSRALEELFRISAEEGTEAGSSWSVEMSMLEIYQEAVHDLLRAPTEAMRSLDVSALGAGEVPAGLDRVVGLTWRKVTSMQAVKQNLKDGSKNRATAATALNAQSSRSHALVSIKLHVSRGSSSSTSLIHLVDLAGSERIEKSEVTGNALKEAMAINKSLSALGDVISALQRRTPHIPFRNSKLTAVLQDSLCGTSKVLLVCNLSPESVSSSETLSSLNFASRAAQVELGSASRVRAVSASPLGDRVPSSDKLSGSGSTPESGGIGGGGAGHGTSRAGTAGVAPGHGGVAPGHGGVAPGHGGVGAGHLTAANGGSSLKTRVGAGVGLRASQPPASPGVFRG